MNPTRGSLHTILTCSTPFPNETGELPIGEFEPLSPTNTNNGSPKSRLTTARVLVVVAGGLGCELLKDLAMSGIQNVNVIDLDTIDVTNLNRQFLFRQSDVGSSKALAVARFINKRCPWMNVTPHHGKIQDNDVDFYASFDVVITGLDNVAARRWLNSMMCGLV